MRSWIKCLSTTLALLLAGSLAACAGSGDDGRGARLTPVVNGVEQSVSAEHTRISNRGARVDPLFPDHPVVLDDLDGLKTSRMLFKNSVSVIVAEDTPEAQARAASLAVFAHAPMLVYQSSLHSQINAEIDRLKARRVLLVGNVGIAQSTGIPTVFDDPGGLTALGKLTAHRFYEQVVDKPEDVARSVAALDGSSATVLVPGWLPAEEDSHEDVPALPIQTRRDGQNSPVTVASEGTPIAEIANARAYGADVTFLDNPDPRQSDTALTAMIGLSDQPLLALGSQFGTDEELAAAIAEAERARLNR